MLKLKPQYFCHLIRRTNSLEKILMLERLKMGEVDNRGWDGWMASPTRWTWVWLGSRSWRWPGKPGVLQSMGSQWVRHDWATELNWILHSKKYTIYVYITFQYFKSVLTPKISYYLFAICFPYLFSWIWLNSFIITLYQMLLLITNKTSGKKNEVLKLIVVCMYCCCCVATKSCLLLLPPHCSPPGSSVHGIFQARILEWVAISFSRGSSRPRDWTRVSCIAGEFFTAEPQGSPFKTLSQILLSGNWY